MSAIRIHEFFKIFFFPFRENGRKPAPMKTLTALSFWQPYAWLIVNGFADVDSRTWRPVTDKLNKKIAVHASNRRVTRDEYQEFLKVVKDRGIREYPASPDEFDYGAIVGTVVIAGVTETSKSYWAAPDHYHWQLREAKRVRPFAQKGRRSWFTVEF